MNRTVGLIVAAVLTLAACGGGNGSSEADTEPTVTTPDSSPGSTADEPSGPSSTGPTIDIRYQTSGASDFDGELVWSTGGGSRFEGFPFEDFPDDYDPTGPGFYPNQEDGWVSLDVPTNELVVDGDDLFTLDEAGTISRFSVEAVRDGETEPVWATTLPGDRSIIRIDWAVGPSSLWFVDTSSPESGEVLEVDRETGAVVGTTAIDPAELGVPGVGFYGDDRGIVASEDGTAFVFIQGTLSQVASGAPNSTTLLSRPELAELGAGMLAHPYVVDDTIYAATGDVTKTMLAENILVQIPVDDPGAAILTPVVLDGEPVQLSDWQPFGDGGIVFVPTVGLVGFPLDAAGAEEIEAQVLVSRADLDAAVDDDGTTFSDANVLVHDDSVLLESGDMLALITGL